ncbi:small conductance mechanosensitive channel [Natranaerovirga hydrolytica]|uniref:Small conductance mechanosensitive channel n=1 Tax=Natranaerovirga hydrolytica TaxID=680378 RepID=A0A4R1MYV3_9FIRM|nr:mechanosensitive ion channel domain-containing protein [Natranaerovirga hydrolytica]TCK98426.1 small conductance mechanosensitive channel [Natranaerovirga hydrolytica]
MIQQIFSSIFNASIQSYSFANIKDSFIGYIIEYGMKIIAALVILFIGLKVIKYISKITRKVFNNYQMDDAVKGFLLSLISIALKLILFVVVVSVLGVPMASFVAVLGAAGLAVGLALQGSLSNFAGGVLILVLRPFSIGDFIEESGSGKMGTVESIDIFYTTLKTIDNKVEVIPNGILSNNTITNFSKNDTRRLDLTFGVGYKDDVLKVKEILHTIVKEHPAVLEDPEPVVYLVELNDSSVDFSVRVWVNSGDLWPTRFDLIEKVKIKFDEVGINIPYPQMDVHLKKED